MKTQNNGLRITKYVLIVMLVVTLIVLTSCVAFSDDDNSMYYAISGYTLNVYEPNTNMVNTYAQPYPIDDVATCPGAVFLTYHKNTNDVYVRVLSTNDYKEIKSIYVYSGENNLITVDNNGKYVYVVGDHYLYKVDWISETISRLDLNTADKYKCCVFTSDYSAIAIGSAYNLTIIDPNTMQITYQRGPSQRCDKLVAIGPNKVIFISTGTPSRRGVAEWWTSLGVETWQVETTIELQNQLQDFDAVSNGDAFFMHLNYVVNNSNPVESKTYGYFTPTSINNSDIIISNDGSRLFIASNQSSIIQVYSTNESYAFLGNISISGKATGLYKGYKQDNIQITQFKIQTLYQTIGITDANVTVYDSNDNFVATGKTDDAGAFACWVNPQLTYKVYVNKSSDNVNHWFTVQTSNTQYGLNIPFQDIMGLNSVADQFLNTTPQTQITHYTDGSINYTTNTGTFTTYYQDTGCNTNAITVSLYKNNSTIGGSPTLLNTQSYSVTNNNQSNIFTTSNAAGNSYYIKIEASQTSGSNKTYYNPIAFAGPTISIPGFPLEWYWWLAFIPALFLFAVGTATKKGMAGIIGMVWAYIANYWNWFSIYVPQWAMYIIITIGIMISIGVIIYESERFRG